MQIKKMKKYIDKLYGVCYNSFKPMKRRSRLNTDFKRVTGGGSVVVRSSSNGPLRAN